MSILRVNIPTGIGDLISVRGLLDSKLEEYSKIQVNVCLNLLDIYKSDNKLENIKFLTDISSLIFNDKKYELLFEDCVNEDVSTLPSKLSADYIIPNLKEQLTFDKRQIEDEYIVITTKSRGMDRQYLEKNMLFFLDAIDFLSKKYKIVILGERVVEMNKEYQIHGSNHIFGIYDYIKVLNNNILDLTIPALGITIPNIDNLKKDCTIMKYAKNVITFGVGGNFSLAHSVGNAISYKNYGIMNWLFKDGFPENEKFFLTENWFNFIERIKKIG